MTPAPEAPAPQQARISVVIVSLNRVATLRRSLELLGDSHEVIVVDNGSRDGSGSLSEEFPAAKFLRLPKNFGLTKALNIGLRTIGSEFILCLHDDTLISGDAVSALADYLEAHPEAGAVCPLLTNSAGSPVPQMRALPTPSDPDPALQPALQPAHAGANPITTECVTGAAIMFRAFFLRALRQVDERYGDYGSSIEISAQMRRAAKKIVILPEVKAIHEQLPPAAPGSAIAGDRAAGTAVFLAKHHGFVSSLLYRLKTALIALLTLNFAVFSGALSGQKSTVPLNKPVRLKS